MAAFLFISPLFAFILYLPNISFDHESYQDIIKKSDAHSCLQYTSFAEANRICEIFVRLQHFDWRINEEVTVNILGVTSLQVGQMHLICCAHPQQQNVDKRT